MPQAPNDDAPLIQEIFKRYATGKHNLRNLRDFLNEHGHIVTKQSILNMLKNPVYTGVVRQGYFSRSNLIAGPKEVREAKGLHRALIDEATFEKVQARRKVNRSRANGLPWLRENGQVAPQLHVQQPCVLRRLRRQVHR